MDRIVESFGSHMDRIVESLATMHAPHVRAVRKGFFTIAGQATSRMPAIRPAHLPPTARLMSRMSGKVRPWIVTYYLLVFYLFFFRKKINPLCFFPKEHPRLISNVVASSSK
jgi:hypothetical protein